MSSRNLTFRGIFLETTKSKVNQMLGNHNKFTKHQVGCPQSTKVKLEL